MAGKLVCITSLRQGTPHFSRLGMGTPPGIWAGASCSGTRNPASAGSPVGNPDAEKTPRPLQYEMEEAIHDQRYTDPTTRRKPW